jgi:hypothetical protein
MGDGAIIRARAVAAVAKQAKQERAANKTIAFRFISSKLLEPRETIEMCSQPPARFGRILYNEVGGAKVCPLTNKFRKFLASRQLAG